MGVLKLDEFRVIWDHYQLCYSCVLSVINSGNEIPDFEYRSLQYLSPREGKRAADCVNSYSTEDGIGLPYWYIDGITPKQYVYSSVFGNGAEVVDNSAFKTSRNLGIVFDAVCYGAWMGFKEGVSNFEDETCDRNNELYTAFFIGDDEFLVKHWDTLIPFMNRLSKGIENWKNSIDTWPFTLAQLHADLKYEFSMVCREHPDFYRKLKAEQDAEQQSKDDEAFKKWGLTLDRENKVLTREGYKTPISLEPREIKLLTDIVQCPNGEIPQMIKKNRVGNAVSPNGRTIASSLKQSLEILGMTLTRGPKYQLKEQTSRP